MHLLLMTGHIAYTEEPLYTRTHEANSLPLATRIRSTAEARRSTVLELEAVYAAAFRDYLDYLAGSISDDRLAEALRERVSLALGLRDEKAAVRAA
jgi:hypothetical protein